MPYHTDKDAELQASNGSYLTGTAWYSVDHERTFDADCGGRDGETITACELVGVMIGDALIRRSQLIAMGCDVSGQEDAMRDALQELLTDTGSIPDHGAPEAAA
ncbi:MAG: hypothetical protein HRT64_15125 [Erythrobacter sp.]|nr:hypothetical protein [Erythrobacter sp.]